VVRMKSGLSSRISNQHIMQPSHTAWRLRLTMTHRSDSGTPRLASEGSSVIHFKDAILPASEGEDELSALPSKIQVPVKDAGTAQLLPPGGGGEWGVS